MTRISLVGLMLLAFTPAAAIAQMADEKSSPFEALRWNEDFPEVMVQSIWYRPVSIQGVEIDAIMAHCKKAHGRRAKKRFGEDLPVILQEMGHSLPAVVDLKLVRLDDGVEVILTDVPSTKRNRTAIWQSNRERDQTNRRTQTRSSTSHLSRQEALADIAELKNRLDDQFAYRHLKDIDLLGQLDPICTSLEDQVKIEDLSLKLHLLMMTFGDGHAGVRSQYAIRATHYPPFLLADAANGTVAFKPDRSGFLDPERPYILAIDGQSIDELVDVARPWITDGSEQLIRTRGLRELRNLELIRSHLGQKEKRTLTCTLATGSDDPDPVVVEVPMSTERPTYGDWPRRETEIIDGNIGYLRINRMDDRLVPMIQSSMDAFRQTDGLIVDVRGNGGGTRLPLITLAGYLLGPDEQPWVGNVARYRLSDEFGRNHLDARYMYRADDPRWSGAQRKAIADLASDFQPEWDHAEGFSEWHYLVLDRTGSDSEYFYDKPVVILSDADCFSATDIFLGAFVDRPRITIMGQPSGGGSARSQGFRLPNSGIEIRCASMASFRPDGRLYDGRGIEVDREVMPGPEHFVRGGDDAVLDAAIQHLQSSTTNDKTTTP